MSQLRNINSGLNTTYLSQLHHLQLTTGLSIFSQVFNNSGTVALRFDNSNESTPDPHRFSIQNITDNLRMQPPSIYSHLPHLTRKPESLTPIIKESRGRTGVSLVFGIPTVKRSAKSYLIGTPAREWMKLHNVQKNEQRNFWTNEKYNGPANY